MFTRRWLSLATVLALWTGEFSGPLAAEVTKKKSGRAGTAAPTKKPSTAGEKSGSASTKKGKSKATDGPEKSSDASAVKKPVPKDTPPERSEKKADPEPPAPAPAATPPASSSIRERAPNATISTSDLAEFAAQPPAVQRLITNALELTKRNLTYTYGSADPTRGGMDCSGTIYYTLRAEGLLDVPRDSSGQYVWVRKAGGFQAVVSTSAETFELDALRPGDLLFWSGTYAVVREIPITHVMLYLGREKKTGQRVMFGASDGRSYRGVQRWGVSVFDFRMPKTDPSRGMTPDFIGYGPIPGLKSSAPVALVETPAPEPVAAALDNLEPQPSSNDTTEKAVIVEKKSKPAAKPAVPKGSSSRKKPKAR